MQELTNKLFHEVSDGYSLNPEQQAKLKLACERVIKENPTATFPELHMGAKIYRNFILEFPDLTL
jgi:hypothetical protein